jgi:hypothetical protein
LTAPKAYFDDAWMRPEGRKPYFIATVTALTYEFVP